MMHGIGTDIIEVARIENAIERYGERFLDRIFTTKEQEYCLRYQKAGRHFAGRFAAKEAVVKSLGTGFGSETSWHDIEIINDSHGKPEVILSPSLQKILAKKGVYLKVSVSISHCHVYATAVAISEKVSSTI